MRMRKKKHGTERMEALSSLICQKNDKNYINSHDSFKNSNPLRLEIGCGKGDFVIGMSEKEPDVNFVAMEKISDVLVIAMEKYASSRNMGYLGSQGEWIREEGEAGNVRFICNDAKNLRELFEESTLDKIYINFCDPWSKKGHTKRRLTYIEFLNIYSFLLKDGGELRFKTDNLPLFEFTLEEIAKSGFELKAYTNDLHNSEFAESNVMTEYERNFSSQGIKINFLIAVNKKQ